MDRFHSQNGTDKLFDDNSFDSFYNNMQDYAKGLLLQMGYDSSIRAAVYRSMKEMKRRSFVDKAEMLLKKLGVSYSDIGVTLSEIVDIRNKITHQGKYGNNASSESFDYLSKVYNALFNILTRIFLVMLKYDGEYFDAPNSKWIKFRDVCTSSS
jgi:hypothetical protein